MERLDGLGFPESLRWHAGALWFSDMFRGRVIRWVPGHPAQTVLDAAHGGPVMPGGLGWLPSGELLVVDCDQRQVLAVHVDSGDVSLHADLSELFTYPANDMYVDQRGYAWVGSYGFDPATEEPRASQLARITPDGAVSLWGDPLIFPNGCEARPDGSLVIAETFADQISIRSPQGTGQVWTSLAPGSGPDGLSVDAQGATYVALAFAGAVIRIDSDGLATVWQAPPVVDGLGRGARGCYDCAISPDGRVLAVAIASLDEDLAQRINTGSIVLLSPDHVLTNPPQRRDLP